MLATPQWVRILCRQDIAKTNSAMGRSLPCQTLGGGQDTAKSQMTPR